MEHHFDIEIAEDVGVSAAIIYYNIKYWCEKNKANGVNYHDEYYWTFNSVKAFRKLFPYLSDKKISSSLKILEDRGYIKSGNYNDSTYDRTKWYADIRTNMGDSNLHNGVCHLPKKENGDTQNGEPIPNINTNINTNNNKDISPKVDISLEKKTKAKKEKFVPPTVEEVRAYCFERNNNIDPQMFVDFYTSKDWMVGKTKMVDWKASVRTWERNKQQKSKQTSTNPYTEMLKEMGYTPEDILYGNGGNINFTG